MSPVTSSRKAGMFDDPSILSWIQDKLLRPLDGFGSGAIEYRFPELGTRTPIAIATSAGGQQAVVKLMRSWYALLRVTSNQRWMRHRGLPVPNVLAWSAISRVSAPKRFVMIEQFIDGPSINELDDNRRADVLVPIATSLAAMHSHQRKRAGPPWLPSPVQAMSRYLPRVLERLEKLRDTLGDTALIELRAQLTEQAGRLAERGRYEFIHGHVNPNNFLIADGTAWIIDLEMVQFGDFGRDLVRGGHRLTRELPDRRKLFLDRYFEVVKGITRDMWYEQAPFYEADFRLARAVGWLRDVTKGRIEQDEFMRKVDVDVMAAREALSGTWIPD